MKNIVNTGWKLRREEAIKALLQNIKKRTNIISTTGFTSRELMQIRSQMKNKKGNDFYMVGGMGHSTMVALGTSLFTKKQTICLDGDGSILMLSLIHISEPTRPY